jgi:hypothetical protein
MSPTPKTRTQYPAKHRLARLQCSTFSLRAARHAAALPPHPAPVQRDAIRPFLHDVMALFHPSATRRDAAAASGATTDTASTSRNHAA